MGTININKLKLHSHIGVSEEERAFPSVLLADISLYLELTGAACKDDLKQTVDYAMVVEILKNHAANNSYKLLEALTQNCIQTLLKEFPQIDSIKMSVSKDIFTDVDSVDVQMILSRD